MYAGAPGGGALLDEVEVEDEVHRGDGHDDDADADADRAGVVDERDVGAEQPQHEVEHVDEERSAPVAAITPLRNFGVARSVPDR